MQTLVTILSFILPLVSSFLGISGVVPTSLVPLINQLASAIPTLISKLTSGGTITDDEIAVLQSIQASIATVDTSLLTAEQQAQLQSLLGAINDAIVAYQQAQTTEDVSTLTPLPESL